MGIHSVDVPNGTGIPKGINHPAVVYVSEQTILSSLIFYLFSICILLILCFYSYSIHEIIYRYVIVQESVQLIEFVLV